MAERALRERLETDCGSQNTVTAICDEPSRVSEAVHSRRCLKGLRSSSIELETFRTDMELALDRLISLPGEEAIERPRTQLPAQKNKVARATLSSLRTELAESRMLLTKRESQNLALLDHGLCLAFEKEALQKRVVELLGQPPTAETLLVRIDNTCSPVAL